jgi:hypothetical protein
VCPNPPVQYGQDGVDTVHLGHHLHYMCHGPCAEVGVRICIVVA